MRLLYVCLDRGVPIGGTKGASIHVAELLRALANQGHEVAVLARAVDEEEAIRAPLFRASVRRRLGWVPGRVLRRDLREVLATRELRTAVRRAIDEFEPDALYERYALFRAEAASEARRAGLPLALEVNAPLAWEERRFRSLALGRTARRAERRAWTTASLVVVPSRPLRELVRSAGQHSTTLVPNAVDAERFAPRDGADTRRRLGLEDRFVVGFAGSVKAWHDLDTLIAAASRLSGAVRPAVLLVGDGPERERLERRARALGVDLVATGAVPHEHVPEYLAAMDVCVAGLPTDSELQYFSPLKALEYLAAGRPTVVAAAGDLAEPAAQGAALGYRPGDADDLAERVRSLAEDADLRARLGHAGRQYARSRTWREAATTVVQALERLRRTASSA